MINKLYRVSNKANNRILIIAKNDEEVKEIALSLNFIKNIDNIKIEDYSDIYLNQKRKEQGLNFDNFESGQFFQIIKNNQSSWYTWNNTNIKNRKKFKM